MSSQARVSLEMCGVIVEDHLDRGVGRIGGIEKLEEFDELAAAVALRRARGPSAGEQIDPGQQAERAMAFVLMIPREARMAAGTGGKSGAVVAMALSQASRRRDDRDRLLRFLRLGSGFFRTWTSR